MEGTIYDVVEQAGRRRPVQPPGRKARKLKRVAAPRKAKGKQVRAKRARPKAKPRR